MRRGITVAKLLKIYSASIHKLPKWTCVTKKLEIIRMQWTTITPAQVHGPKRPVLETVNPVVHASEERDQLSSSIGPHTGPNAMDRRSVVNQDQEVHHPGGHGQLCKPKGPSTRPQVVHGIFLNHIFQRRYWTCDFGPVDQVHLIIHETKLQKNWDVRPYTAGGPSVQWDNWLDGGGTMCLPPYNQLCRNYGQCYDQAITSFVSVTAWCRRQGSAPCDVRTERLVFS